MQHSSAGQNPCPCCAQREADAKAHTRDTRAGVWSTTIKSYLQQQISQASNAKERADAVRLAQTLARP